MILFHMGMPKTGTTSVQHVLHQHAGQLAAAGIHYPATGRNNEGLAHHGFGEAAADLSNPKNQKFCTAFLEDLLASGSERVIVSSEAMTNALAIHNRDRFLKLLADTATNTPVMALLYLRRIDSFHESMYLHSVKVGETSIGFDAYLDLRTKWADHFFAGLAMLQDLPGTLLDLQIFGRADDHVKAFLAAAGCGDVIEVAKDDRAPRNVRLGLKAQSALLALPDLVEDVDLLNRPRLVRLMEEGQFGFSEEVHDYTIFDAQRRVQVIENARHAAINAKITSYASAFDDTIKPAPHQQLCADNLDATDIDRFRTFCREAGCYLAAAS